MCSYVYGCVRDDYPCVCMGRIFMHVHMEIYACLWMVIDVYGGFWICMNVFGW